MRALLARNLIDTALSVGTLVAAAHFGLHEAATSRILYGLLWFLLYAAWLQRIVGFAWRAMGAIYLRSALLALLTITPALWAIHSWRSEDTLGFSGLAVAGTLSGMVWLLGIIVLRHPAREDLIGMALHIVGPMRRRLAATGSHG